MGEQCCCERLEKRTPYWKYESPGKETVEVFDVGVALALLLLDEVIFPHNATNYVNCIGNKHTTVALSVEGHSTYSDAEDVSYEEVQSLYDLWKEDNDYGPIIWLCKKRKCVSSEHEARLRSAGLWNNELEALKTGRVVVEVSSDGANEPK